MTLSTNCGIEGKCTRSERAPDDADVHGTHSIMRQNYGVHEWSCLFLPVAPSAEQTQKQLTQLPIHSLAPRGPSVEPELGAAEDTPTPSLLPEVPPLPTPTSLIPSLTAPLIPRLLSSPIPPSSKPPPPHPSVTTRTDSSSASHQLESWRSQEPSATMPSGSAHHLRPF